MDVTVRPLPCGLVVNMKIRSQNQVGIRGIILRSRRMGLRGSGAYNNNESQQSHQVHNENTTHNRGDGSATGHHTRRRLIDRLWRQQWQCLVFQLIQQQFQLLKQ